MAPIFWHFDTVIFNYGTFGSLFICLFLAIGYVASLYIGGPKHLGRDHPATIKHRIIRVCILSIFTLPFLWLCSTKSHDVKARPLLTWIGIRFEGCILAVILPLILTMILFMGPLSLHYIDGVFLLYKDPKYWASSFRNLIWIRNHVVAPFSEEFVYRACMLPVLVPAFGEVGATFVCPLLFGVAHFHHIREKMKDGMPLDKALMTSLFQFSYTTVFGIYSAFLFLRTGHLLAPVIAHAFCNHMGFPNFHEIQGHQSPTRHYVAAAFFLGLVLWYQLLYLLTTPSWYGNNLYNL